MNADCSRTDGTIHTVSRVGVRRLEFFARASENISAGETVESFPVIPVPHRGRNTGFNHESLRRMMYPALDEGEVVIGLGLSTRYAFSSDPNVNVIPERGRIYRTVALRDIGRGEVITRSHQFSEYLDGDNPIPETDPDLAISTDWPISLCNGQYGMGVSATRDISKGEIVEECPMNVVTGKAVFPSGVMGLGRYSYDWPMDRPEERWKPRAVAMGFGSIYNHSSGGENLTSEYMDRRTYRGMIRFFALTDIKAGDEMTHDYGWGPSDSRFMS